MSGPKLTESGNLEEFLKRASAEIERATLEVLPTKEPYKELYSLQKDYPLRGGKRFRSALLLLCAEWFGASYEDALPSVFLSDPSRCAFSNRPKCNGKLQNERAVPIAYRLLATTC